MAEADSKSQHLHERQLAELSKPAKEGFNYQLFILISD